ncbi:MAG: hypothetical protein K8S99_10510 [Planctomycetes bacterium]|nr:hypothetical protein [Planctomycetota bacterium]
MTPPRWNIPHAAPVIAPGQLHGDLDARRASAAHVIQLGDRFRMVYWGGGKDGKNRILAAESPLDRPNDWSPLGVVIGPQPETVHNSVGPSFPFLLPVDERRWMLYFCAWGHQPGKRLPNTSGAAISDDAGKTWRYHDANPMIPLDRPYDAQGTGSLWVIRENGTFRMWYTAIAECFNRPVGVASGHGESIPRIGLAYAESGDGLHWTKPFDQWVVAPRAFGVEPYEYITSKPAIIVCDAPGTPRYTLWLNTFGTAYRVHRLTSDNGTDWNWSPRVGPEGELGVGAPGSFDDHQRSYPTMLRHGRELRCWYTGNSFGDTGMGYAVAAPD